MYFLLHFWSFRGHYAKNMNSLNLRALQFQYLANNTWAAAHGCVLDFGRF